MSTLLALMDGLDPRGAVVVVGATNRPDALDPALRRPGRFDRELLFPLPNEGARAAILRIHTRGWASPPDARTVAALAARTSGFGGADLKALCTEAALRALRRAYPSIYESDARLDVRPSDVGVTRRDWLDALGGVTPASARSAAGCTAALPPHLAPALGGPLAAALAAVRAAFAPAAAVMDAAAAGTVGSLAVRGVRGVAVRMTTTARTRRSAGQRRVAPLLPPSLPFTASSRRAARLPPPPRPAGRPA